jgi:hypothetical protein
MDLSYIFEPAGALGREVDPVNALVAAGIALLIGAVIFIRRHMKSEKK